ncbi:hypothetical protein LGH70_07100 [Hymenobacter sp. BT635]|uniref:Uncharacterized protein n=1 Tax=Hymenobacter nitidus TaxID=2880929 RepID=A0ABS8AAP3_9BACT|nr:hypothetical protein [Hymenobacter nitidus]MCB2377341.1 hypothetical protein [Hymenobacter nitidus]
MPNRRIHPYLHIDRTCCTYVYSGRTNCIRQEQPLPDDGAEYVVLPQNILPKDNVTLPLQVRINEAGQQTRILDEASYNAAFLHRFFNPAYTTEDRLALLEAHYGRYTRTRTPESFLDFLDRDIIAHAPVLLGIKEEAASLWQQEGGQLLRQWIQRQRGYLERPIGIRNGKSQAQVLDLKSQLAVVHYLHRGKMWPGPLLPTKDLAGFLAGVLARSANNIEPLLRFLTEPPSQERNLVLNEKYIARAKKHFEDAQMPLFAQLAADDLEALQ